MNKINNLDVCNFLIQVTEIVESKKHESKSSEQPKKTSKMEITLQSTAKVKPTKRVNEILLSDTKSPESPTFKTQIEAKIDETNQPRFQSQRSEVAFPVAAVVSQIKKSASCGHKEESSIINRNERIIPIQVFEPSYFFYFLPF